MKSASTTAIVGVPYIAPALGTQLAVALETEGAVMLRTVPGAMIVQVPWIVPLLPLESVHGIWAMTPSADASEPVELLHVRMGCDGSAGSTLTASMSGNAWPRSNVVCPRRRDRAWPPPRRRGQTTGSPTGSLRPAG